MTITAAELLVRVGADVSDAESGLKSFSGKMKNIGGQMASVGGVLSATIAAPLIGIAVASVKTAADFEKSMNVLGYASGATADQMQALSDQALQLGADTVFSANEAAEGMVDLAKAGMSTADIMGAIPGVMDLAAAGQIGVSEAANLTAAALNTFSLEATESGRVADVLAAAANASTAEVSDLAFGLQNAGSVFASNGQSLETLATMMALMANNGIDAGTAATQLRTMTQSLTAPTAKAAKVMKNLGLQVFDAEGNMRDYHDIIQDLSSATKNMTDAQKDAAFQIVFGQDAMTAANVMVMEGVKGYEAMNTAVMEQGASAAMAEAQNKGLSGAIEQIGGSVESLFTKLSIPFLPQITEIGDKIKEFINSIGELPQPVINAGLAFGGFAIAIALGTAAIGAILLVLPTLLSPIGLIAIALVLAGAAAAALWAAWELNFGNIQDKTATVIDAMSPYFTTLTGFLTSVGTEAATAATNLGKIIATSFEDANFPTFDEMFADVLAGDFSGLTGKLQAALDKLVLNLKVNLDLEAKLSGAQKQLSSAFDAIVDGIDFKGPAAKLTTKLKELTTTINAIDLTGIDWWSLVNKWVMIPLGVALNFISVGTDKFGTLVKAVQDGIAKVEWGDLGGAFNGLRDAVIGQLSAVVNDIIGDLTPMLFLLSLKVGQMVRDLFPAAPPPPPPPPAPEEFELDGKVGAHIVAGMISNLTTTIQGGDWGGAGRTMGNLIVDAWNREVDKIIIAGAIFMGIGGVIKNIDTFRHQVVDALVQFGAELSTIGLPAKIAQLGTQIANAISTMFTNLIGQIMERVMPNPDASSTSDILRERELGPSEADKVFQSITDALGPLKTAADAAGEAFGKIGGFVDGLVPSFDSVAAAAGVIATAATTATGAADTLAVAFGAAATIIAAFRWPAEALAFSWNTWMDHLNWGDFIGWLSIPGAGGGSGGGNGQDLMPSIPNAATGTSYHKGGSLLVGEHGPELVSLPQGSRVYSNQDSMAMAGGVTINVNVASINSGMDIEQLAAQLARRFQQKLRL